MTSLLFSPATLLLRAVSVLFVSNSWKSVFQLEFLYCNSIKVKSIVAGYLIQSLSLMLLLLLLLRAWLNYSIDEGSALN